MPTIVSPTYRQIREVISAGDEIVAMAEKVEGLPFPDRFDAMSMGVERLQRRLGAAMGPPKGGYRVVGEGVDSLHLSTLSQSLGLVWTYAEELSRQSADTEGDGPRLAVQKEREIVQGIAAAVKLIRWVVDQNNAFSGTDALYDYCHSIGWMLSRQRALSKANREQKYAESYGSSNPALARDIEEIGNQIKEAWKEVQDRRQVVRDTLVAPPYPIRGVQPGEWLQGVLMDVDEAAEAVGGPFQEMPRFWIWNDQDGQCCEALQRLDARVKELRALPTNPTPPAPAREQETPAKAPAHAASATTTSPRMSKEAKALAALADHPDWTDEQIAQAAGCNRNSLYRMSKFRSARRVLKGGKNLIPKGSKDAVTGDVEAWDNE